MKNSLKKFAILFGSCIVITLAITLFNEFTLAVFINIGSYVGALFLALGSWRLFGNRSNDAIEQLHMTQRMENVSDQMHGRDPMHKDVVPMTLPSGALFSSGLAWLVLLQTIRYTLGVVI